MPHAPAEAERNIKNAVESRSWAGSKRCKVYRESGKIHHKGAICLSIEVKSGKTGTLRSMLLYLKKADLSIGVKISQLPFDDTLPIISIPFYAIKKIPEFISSYIYGATNKNIF